MMGFSDKQERALKRGVPAIKIRTRVLNGREFPYIEGWHAIAEANRIFGFAGWNRETVESRCIFGRDTRGGFLAIYTAKVRITVHAGDSHVVREGNGGGEAKSASPGEAHEVALKAAETDATKRALATFGKPFGLALYLNRPTEQQKAAAHNHAPVDLELKLPSAASNATSAVTPQIEALPPPPLPSLAPAAEQIVETVLDAAHPRVPTRVDKSQLRFGEQRRERDKHHLLFVAQQPCLICSRLPCDAHHLRFAQPRALGRKVGDQFTVPLCREHHRQVHECTDEASWWSDLEVDAIEIAKGLWEEGRAKRAELVRSLPGAIDPLSLPHKAKPNNWKPLSR